MKYFNKTKLLAIILQIISALVAICAFIWADGWMFWILLSVSFFLALIGFVSRFIAKEANSELTAISDYYDKAIKELKAGTRPQ